MNLLSTILVKALARVYYSAVIILSLTLVLANVLVREQDNSHSSMRGSSS